MVSKVKRTVTSGEKGRKSDEGMPGGELLGCWKISFFLAMPVAYGISCTRDQTSATVATRAVAVTMLAP